MSILHREREDIEQIPNLGGGQIVKQVGDPPRGNLKGLFTIFLFLVSSHILSSNGVWYS